MESGTAGLGTLTIAYDAVTQSYTISTAGRSATFAPADLVASGSADLVAYEKLGSTNQALSLTRPGTSGPLTYRYVGGGAWERATLASDQLDFTYDPFTYGVETPNASLPRTGAGRYAVSLVGARGMEAPYSMAGSGGLQIDFLGGTLTSSGVITSIDVGTGLIKGVGLFYGEASLSSTVNGFGGDFFMDDGKRFTGSWLGRFYGPAAEEVGAAWSLTSADGEMAAGYMLGRQDANVPGVNTSLADLQYSQDFSHRFSQLSFTDLGAGKSGTDLDLLRSDGLFRYDAAATTFRYVDSARSIDTQFGAASLVPAETTSALSVYKITGGDGLTYKLSLNKAGAGNPTIALTYASFGHWERLQGAASERLDRWFGWGLRTNGFQIPTGTGHFEGIIVGTAAKFNGSGVYRLSGTSMFDMNFGSGSFTGSLNPIGTNLADGSTRNFGTFSFDRGAIDLDAGLTADIVNGSSAYLGFFEGALYGPSATEIAGSFGMQSEVTSDTSNPSANAAYLSGAIVAKRLGN